MATLLDLLSFILFTTSLTSSLLPIIQELLPQKPNVPIVSGCPLLCYKYYIIPF